MTSTPEPPYLQIGAQLEPGEVWAGVSVGHARMVLSCSGCDGTWILPPNVRGVHELAAMEEYHLAEAHGIVTEPDRAIVGAAQGALDVVFALQGVIDAAGEALAAAVGVIEAALPGESEVEQGKAWAPGAMFTVNAQLWADADALGRGRAKADWLTKGNVYLVTSVDDAGLRLGFTGDDGQPDCGIGVQYVTRVEPR